MNLAKGAPLKVVVTKDVPKDAGLTHPRPPSPKTEKRAKRPRHRCRRCLLLSSRADQNKEAVLDLIRGRTETIEPTGDARRTHVRTN